MGFGLKIYTKRNLTKKAIDNFLKAYKFGIGIKIVEYNYNEGWIKMEGGVSLRQHLN